MRTIQRPHSQRNIGLLGVGAYRPARIVTNDEVTRAIDSSDEWIQSRTGIKTRRFAAADDTVHSMAIAAAQTALRNAGLTGSDIAVLIVATSTNARLTPSTAPTVASALGATGIPAFDLATGCAGFGYALGVATDLLNGGGIDNALIIGSETLSPWLDMEDRGNCFIFGDGAGAVVIGDTPAQGIGPTVWGSDGSQSEAIRQSVDFVSYCQDPDGPRPYLRMEGTAVFRWASTEMSKVGHQAIQAAGLEPGDIDVFIPHQANSRINAVLARDLHLRPDAVIANDIETAGNTSAASIPLAMDTLLSDGSAKPGDTALLLGYGSGLSYAASVVSLPAGHSTL